LKPRSIQKQKNLTSEKKIRGKKKNKRRSNINRLKWIRENQWRWQKIVGWFYCIYAKEEKRMKNLLQNCENGDSKKSRSNKNTQN
jgi:hypothetical protein